ncbi:MAG: NAD+ synthase [Ktedonobacterales bacterium]
MQPMQARRLRIALAQINVTVGDLAGNVARMLAAARQAHDEGATLVAFPELALTGYPPEDLLLKPGFVADNLAALDHLTRETANLSGLTLVVGFVDRVVDIYNAAAVLREGRRYGVYHKQYLPNYGVFDEDRYFSAGTRTPLFIIDGVTVGVSICEDAWRPVGVPTTQGAAGAEVLLNISASPFFVGKQGARERMLATRAADTGAMVAYLNLVGGQDELVFDGSSVVFDGHGELVARARAFAEDLLVVDLDIEEVFRTRLHDPLRREDRAIPQELPIERIVVSQAPATPPAARHTPAVSVKDAAPPRLGSPARIEPLPDRVEEAYRALVLGVGDYVRKCDFHEAIIGLSGGIDSALTAAIAVDALGPDKVIGISMPSRYSSTGSRDDAQALAQNLGIRYLSMPIEAMFAATMETLREPLATFPPVTHTLTEENVQARLRGLLWMALSNQSGAIVLTAGNKSEMAVGYATLYGDMAGGFAVLKDVFKTLVYDLARWRNARAQDEIGHLLIPPSTIEKPPSAELRPDQRDTDALPPYDVLDSILRAYVEEDRSFAGIVALGFAPDAVRQVMRLVDRSEYKRRQAPPGVKITARAFGRDRRLPITNAYRGQPTPYGAAHDTEATNISGKNDMKSQTHEHEPSHPRR